jgi:hypothetical protein
MKRKSHLAVLSIVMFAAHGAAISASVESPFPSDAEASYDLLAPDTYADQQARAGNDGGSESWGVGRRQAPMPHDPFPFGGGYIDD